MFTRTFLKNYPSIQAFVSYVSRFKGAFWLTAASFAISDAIITAIPWMVGQLAIGLSSQNDTIMFWTVALILASVGHDAIWRASEVLFMKLLLPRSHRFDDVVFAEVIKHDYGFFVDKFTGKISSYANSLGRDFREMLNNFHFQYVNLAVSMPIIAITMFTVNSYTGYIFVVSLVLMYLSGRKLAQLSAKAERAEANERSSVDGLVVDAISNFVSVKAFRSERDEASRLYAKRDGLIKAANYSFFRAILFWGMMSLFVRWIIWPSTFILNVWLYTQGRIDLAQITTFLTVIVLFSSFIWQVIWNIAQLNIKIAGVEEAYRYLFRDRNIFDKSDNNTKATNLQVAAFDKSLELRGLSFAYPDKPQTAVLHDVRLRIAKGEKVGIVGPSGGGKSTLLKLLLGYYPVPSGQLLLDGQPIDNRTLPDLAAYVPQDTAMFHRSVRENITYGRQDAEEAEVIAAAKHAHAHEFILNLDKGYDTLVGERGVKLSGGQRQRIAIARAILKDAPLLLLDEATSALDSESEKLIQAALRDLLEQRTALVIAHRLSTIQHMDRIIVFDDGRIVEEGTHTTLIAKKGLYAKLWAHQTDGFIED